jgi:hypothetical protein
MILAVSRFPSVFSAFKAVAYTGTYTNAHKHTLACILWFSRHIPSAEEALVTKDSFAVGVSPGGWGEEYQGLWFVFDLDSTDNPGLIERIDMSCNGTQGGSWASRGQCPGRVAHMRVMSARNKCVYVYVCSCACVCLWTHYGYLHDLYIGIICMMCMYHVYVCHLFVQACKHLSCSSSLDLRTLRGCLPF